MTITQFFSHKGPLSKQFSSYEIREGQIKLAERIKKIFDEGGIGMYEAGTGIGKSLAYLYPAYLQSLKNNLPVIVSTSTNNLLSQLVTKDLPLLQKVLEAEGKELKFIGVKGKSHYACIAKIEGSIDESVVEIAQDLNNTKNGERSELSYQIYDEDWRKLSYDRESCLGSRCPFYKDCFITNIKKKAEKANIVVTNHNIVFAEKLAKFKILPDYETIIFDEAHNIEDIATDYLTQTFALSQLKSLAYDLYFSDGRNKGGLGSFSKFKNYSEEFISLSEKIYQEKNNLEEWIRKIFSETNSWQDGNEFTIKNIDLLQDKLEQLKNYLLRIIELLDGVDLGSSKQMLLVSSVQNLTIILLDWIKNIHDSNNLLWGKVLDNGVYLYETPLEIGRLLKKEIYDSLNSVVILSATLSVNNNFNFMKKRLGVEDFEKGVDFDDHEFQANSDSDIFESPFDYSEQMKVVIRKDMPDPRSNFFQEKLSSAILEAVTLTKGNAFVLFTSYGMMKEAAESLRPILAVQNIPLYVQESGNREEIIRKFREGNSVLFGVESFWEGVDIPGSALSHVIITKLPFKVPSTPVEKARAQEVEVKGGNSFYDLSLPQAVIKFRQGIGRLIRTKNDQGYVTILDSRIVNSSYGSVFIKYLIKN